MVHHYDGPEHEENNPPQKKGISDAVKEFKKSHSEEVKETPENLVKAVEIPSAPTTGAYSPEQYQEMMQKETDPDLVTSYELIKLPSQGLFYPHKIGEVQVEYMTSKDEDLLTTPSLIESGKVIDLLLKRKIKTPQIKVEELLPGDRNAIILFLRTSSYGHEYTVEVVDPRNGIPFQQKVDLLKLEYKEMKEKPDQNGHFTVEIPMRKKRVTFRLMSGGEEDRLFEKAEAIKEAYGHEFSEYNTMKLKAHIININGNGDRGYIEKFVDAMPALDAYTIRKKIQDVSPDVDMEYEFRAKDGFKFKAVLSVGTDFFFPGT